MLPNIYCNQRYGGKASNWKMGVVSAFRFPQIIFTGLRMCANTLDPTIVLLPLWSVPVLPRKKQCQFPTRPAHKQHFLLPLLEHFSHCVRVHISVSLLHCDPLECQDCVWFWRLAHRKYSMSICWLNLDSRSSKILFKNFSIWAVWFALWNSSKWHDLLRYSSEKSHPRRRKLETG